MLPDLVLNVQDALTRNFTMQLGSRNESITVIAVPSLEVRHQLFVVQMFHFCVRLASSGLKAADSLRPDVVLVDIGMPSLNGLDAGRRLKHTNPTMSNNVEYAREALQAVRLRLCSKIRRLRSCFTRFGMR